MAVTRSQPESAKDIAADSLYVSALSSLDLSNRSSSLDDGIAKLEAYLASGAKLKHAAEAKILRRLGRDALQLGRVEAALQQSRVNVTDAKDAKTRDDEAVKEIQRLKDELAKANAELDRIKKRLVTPGL